MLFIVWCVYDVHRYFSWQVFYVTLNREMPNEFCLFHFIVSHFDYIWYTNMLLNKYCLYIIACQENHCCATQIRNNMNQYFSFAVHFILNLIVCVCEKDKIAADFSTFWRFNVFYHYYILLLSRFVYDTNFINFYFLCSYRVYECQ